MTRLCMRVTTDELSLPEAVAGSFVELAEMCGISLSSIKNSRNLYRKGKLKHEKYIVVYVDEDEENEQET